MKRFYCSIDEVIKEPRAHWIYHKNGISSAVLQFKNDSTPKLFFYFSDSCTVTFPYKIKKQFIEVPWNFQIRSKEIYEITEVMMHYSKLYKNRPFIRLYLLNDTTLLAKYPNENLRNLLNAASMERILFPDKFYIKDKHILKEMNDELDVRR